MRSLLAFLLVSAAVGCSSVVIDGDDDDGVGGSGGTGECGEPPPSDGWCPPAWECVDGAWVDYGGACPEPECPAQAPAWHAECPLIGQECHYNELDCGGGEVAECTADGWEVYTAYCSPPLECPEQAPTAGTSCEGWDYAWDCYYAVEVPCSEQGEEVLFAYCDTSNYTWYIDAPTSCEPLCQYDTPDACNDDLACRWLAPGCGDNPIPFEKCAPDDGCKAAGCGLDEVCTIVNVDPCFGFGCDACSEDFDVCLPSMGE